MASSVQQINALVMNYDTALDHIQQSLQAAVEAVTDLQHADSSSTANAAKQRDLMKQMYERVREMSKASAKLQAEKSVLERVGRGMQAGSVNVEDAVDVFGQSTAEMGTDKSKLSADFKSLMKEFEALIRGGRQNGGQDDMQIDQNAEEHDSEQEEDDDVQMMQHTQTFVCPITQLRLDNPYSSSICKHSFSKEAIFNYLKQGAHKKCPVGGCRNILTKEQLKPNKSLARQLQRLDYDAAMSQHTHGK